MKRNLARILLFLIITCSSVGNSWARDQWSAEKANDWYRSMPWMVGANFSPSTAINQLEMWQAESFDMETIARELKWAGELGFTSLRVYLHDLLWKSDKEGFIERADWFLSEADKNGIGIMFVLMDGVWDPHPKLGKQRDPHPHRHNSGWVQSPGVKILKNPSRHDELKDYIHGFIRHFRADKRVHAWDIFNEPDNMNRPAYEKHEPKNKRDLATQLLKKAYGWARDADPEQPITSAPWLGPWNDPSKFSEMVQFMLKESDVITFHSYGNVDHVGDCVQSLRRWGRPILCTEYMARGNDSKFDPNLGYMKQQNVGAYNWGFVSGKSQTIYPWDSWTKEYTSEPDLWFHDIFRKDGSPYNLDEVKYIKRLTNRKNLAPGSKWRKGSMDRPRPRVVDAGTASTNEKTGRPPSDAIVLFDGTNLSKWKGNPRKDDPDKSDKPRWEIKDGYMQVLPKGGGITTRDKFGSSQFHVEWATPSEVKGNSQGRGNSGFYIQGHPEIQVLDSYQNDTYPDGQASALYNLSPPMVNASRPPGVWQSYDVIYYAPEKDASGKITKPATYTVLHNGILVHHSFEVPGDAVECSIFLQDHSNPVRYRNIWVRPLTEYDENNPGKIGKTLRKYIDNGTIAGGVALTMKKGEIADLTTVGYANLEKKEAMKPDAIFAIASMTKPMSATAVLILQERGKLDLKDEVSKYIPRFADLKMSDGSAPRRPLTLFDLITHTSGIGRPEIDRNNAPTLEEYAEMSAKAPLQFQPGSKWSYSNGISVLGRVIEIVSGKPFDEFLQENIFDPLKMKDSTFNPTESQRARIATLYQPGEHGGLVEADHIFLTKDSSVKGIPNPSGGLFSTAYDVGRFYQMILNGGELDGVRIVSKETAKQMTTIQTGDLKTGFTPGNGWGLGWCVIREPQNITGMLSPGTFGHGGAWGTQVWVDPVKEIVYVLMIQRLKLPNSDGSQIRKEYQQAAADVFGMVYR